MTDIQKKLFELKDKKYAEFQSRLTPGVDSELIIGVRVPYIRKLAKEIIKEGKYREFINTLPHKYYDENLLHGVLISEVKDYDRCVELLDKFLPYVDNWAVCDTMSPKCFVKNKERLIVDIRRWSASDHTYTSRFGMKSLMSHYLDDEFEAEYLLIPASVRSDEYYVNMMIAWFFATALAKQWDAAISYIEKEKLSVWVHNKAIQKAIESRRITDAQKAYLRTLKTGVKDEGVRTGK